MLKSLARQTVRGTLDLFVVRPSRRWNFIQPVIAYIKENASPSTYDVLKTAFIRNGTESAFNRRTREEIVRRFERIDQDLPVMTSPTDALFLAEALLSLRCGGEIVECGCYAGGSTAKLSIVAALTGRSLHIFDSFEGLPAVDPFYVHDRHARHGLEWSGKWTKGKYSASLDTVRANVVAYGEPAVCRFFKGWFAETLTGPTLPPRIAFAFTDVDLAPSARACLLAIWPRMAEGAIYFSHDIAFIKVLQALTDDHLWREILREPQPIIFGAGYGLCDASPHLGFLVKGTGLSAEDIKGLTLELG